MIDSKIFDGTTASTATPMVTGLQGADSVISLSQRFDAPDAGARMLLVNGGFVINDGNAGANYLLTTTAAAGSIAPLPNTASLPAMGPSGLASTVLRGAAGNLFGIASTPTNITIGNGDPNAPILIIEDPRFSGILLCPGLQDCDVAPPQ